MQCEKASAFGAYGTILTSELLFQEFKRLGKYGIGGQGRAIDLDGIFRRFQGGCLAPAVALVAGHQFLMHCLEADREPFACKLTMAALGAGFDAGGDEKLLCVPVNKTFPYYSDVVTYKDMPPIVLQQIEHFFTHYKDLEPGKWAKLNGWGDENDAKRIITECVERAKERGI
mgnify:CR=1 FL=1